VKIGEKYFMLFCSSFRVALCALILKGDGLITSTASVSYINFQVSSRCGQTHDMVKGKLFMWTHNNDVLGLFQKFQASFSVLLFI
jgi:hypothetical protein